MAVARRPGAGTIAPTGLEASHGRRRKRGALPLGALLPGAADRSRRLLPGACGAGRIVLGVRLGTAGDQIGELPHRLEVAQLGELRESERVEAVAAEQREVAVARIEQAAVGVVQQVALAYGCERESVRIARWAAQQRL